MSPSHVIVGIDLGTTYSLVSILESGGPRVLPNALGELLTPSAVSFLPDGTVLVGAAARARYTTHPESTVLSFKRDMGTDKTYRLGGRELRPQELSALVLGALKRDAEAALGCEVREAVVTVPAYFGDLQRQATRDAGAIAGLTVERIINEPTAAALAYGLHEREREQRVVVLDLGGGTFDVTVLEIIEGVIEIQASAGDTRLGGDDFDRALARLVVARITETLGRPPRADAETQARIVSACEEAKRRLSELSVTQVVLPALAMEAEGTADVAVELSRADAETSFAELVERLRAPIARALRAARVLPSAIEEVLLVGGSTRMPCVARLVAQVFGRLPVRKLPPDEAVAMGAAVQAALKVGAHAVEDLVVTDIAPFSLGISTAERLDVSVIEGLFTPILERGTVIPASRVERFSTMSQGQREIRIQVYQGEHARVEDNQKLGEYLVRGIPYGPAGSQTIEVRFTYDLNGILEVETTVTSTGKTSSLVIERGGARLGRKEIEQARALMASLKIHPRELLPNTTALARADALYVELTGEPRRVLGMHIVAFQGALERQDPARIAAERERLNAVVHGLRESR